MPVETKYVVTREGKEIGVFASQSEAEAFEAMFDRAEKLAVVLTATAHEHNLDMESVQKVARALAGRDKELGAIFGGAAKGKTGKGVRSGRGGKGLPKKAAKAAPNTTSPMPEAA